MIVPETGFKSLTTALHQSDVFKVAGPFKRTLAFQNVERDTGADAIQKEDKQSHESGDNGEPDDFCSQLHASNIASPIAGFYVCFRAVR